MRAVVREEYRWDAVRVADVPTPEPGRGQVRVRVEAAALDRGTCHLVTGTPYAVRLAFGLRRPRQPVLGLDVAGTVEAVGPAVTGLAVGDAVVGTAAGALAEQVVARADRLAHRPDDLAAAEAAALPVSGTTALQALVDHGRVRPGQRVLITGASGGVGTYAVQMAVALGAEVVGVCSAGKAPVVRELGATVVLDYAADPLPTDGSVDLIVDIGGATPVADLRRALTPTGRIVLVGAEGGGPLLGGVSRQAGAAVGSLVRRQKAAFFVAAEGTERVQAVLDMVRQHGVRPRIDRVAELAKAPEALRYLDAGHACGKVVIRVGD